MEERAEEAAGVVGAVEVARAEVVSEVAAAERVVAAKRVDEVT